MKLSIVALFSFLAITIAACSNPFDSHVESDCSSSSSAGGSACNTCGQKLSDATVTVGDLCPNSVERWFRFKDCLCQFPTDACSHFCAIENFELKQTDPCFDDIFAGNAQCGEFYGECVSD